MAISSFSSRAFFGVLVFFALVSAIVSSASVKYLSDHAPPPGKCLFSFYLYGDGLYTGFDWS
jgi:hypothetical protein